MAIAFDAATNGGLTFGGPLTFAHTITGSDRILFVGVFGSTVFVDPTGTDITGVTYNGVALSQVAQIAEQGDGVNDRWAYLYYLVAPDTGTHNVVIGGTGVQGATAASYTGASGVNLGSTAQAGPAATSVSANVALVPDNGWTVGVIKESVGQAVTGTDSWTNRLSDNVIGLHMLDSNGALSAGTHAVGGSGGAAAWALVAQSMIPVATQRKFLLHGGGW